MANTATDDGAINYNSTEHSISNRIDTSNLTGYKYIAAIFANRIDTADNALKIRRVVSDNTLKNSAKTSKTILNSLSRAIRPFK